MKDYLLKMVLLSSLPASWAAWEANIVVTAEANSQELVFGEHPNALDGFDNMDAAVPPLPPTEPFPVYLDAVFYPRLTPFTLQQEGWHLQLDAPDQDLIYKGVVFNEMKGAYSSPENLLSLYSLQSLFPDNAYSFDSGGDPKEIPNRSAERRVGREGRDRW